MTTQVSRSLLSGPVLGPTNRCFRDTGPQPLGSTQTAKLVHVTSGVVSPRQSSLCLQLSLSDAHTLKLCCLVLARVRTSVVVIIFCSRMHNHNHTFTHVYTHTHTQTHTHTHTRTLYSGLQATSRSGRAKSAPYKRGCCFEEFRKAPLLISPFVVEGVAAECSS